jgi:hypothetical protein
VDYAKGYPSDWGLAGGLSQRLWATWRFVLMSGRHGIFIGHFRVAVVFKAEESLLF